MKVSIVNYGIGNLLSVQRAFMKCGASVELVDNQDAVARSDRLVVPGVGAFARCMQALEMYNLKQSLIDFALSGRPYLGICVGMQMLLQKSYEFGEHDGLGIIPGVVKKIDIPGERVPFIGWKKVTQDRGQFNYYFVHSYCAVPSDDKYIIGTYDLKGQNINAILRAKNVIGTQFHPEKSGVDGLDFINYFLKQ